MFVRIRSLYIIPNPYFPNCQLLGGVFDGAKAYKDTKVCNMMTVNALHKKFHASTGTIQFYLHKHKFMQFLSSYEYIDKYTCLYTYIGVHVI